MPPGWAVGEQTGSTVPGGRREEASTAVALVATKCEETSPAVFPNRPRLVYVSNLSVVESFRHTLKKVD